MSPKLEGTDRTEASAGPALAADVFDPGSGIVVFGGGLVMDKIGDTEAQAMRCVDDDEEEGDDFLGKIKVLAPGVATAETSLFFGPWSRKFVHGPDIMLPVGSLVESLLLPSQIVTGIQSLKFLKLVKHELQLFAYIDDGREVNFGNYSDEDPSVVACFKANLRGKVTFIKVVGFQTKGRIDKKLGFNCFAEDIGKHINNRGSRCLIRNEGERKVYEFPLEPLSGRVAELLADQGSLGLQMHIAMELVLCVSNRLRGTVLSNVAYAAGFQDFRFSSLNALSEGGAIRFSVDYDKRKETSRGFAIVPCRFTFCDSDGREVGSGIYNRAQPIEECAIDRIHEKM